MMFLDLAEFPQEGVLYVRFVKIVDELKLFHNRQKRALGGDVWAFNASRILGEATHPS